MKTIQHSSKRQKSSRLFRFLSICCCLCTAMLLMNPVSSQTFPGSCPDNNCTANDVRVISAYLSGPDNTPINCADAQPFADAELHLIVFSNTQRKGVSIAGVLNANGVPHNFVNCFTGKTLNNGGNNNLVYTLPFALTEACGVGFSLTNLFVSWGTGKTDFCDGSTAGHCPETKAKCRFVPGEEIPVTVKLEVDFTSLAGVCEDGGNSLSFTFTPEVTTSQNVLPPFKFTWDFGDGSPIETTTSNSLSDADLQAAAITHTYLSEGTYTVTLIGSDGPPDPVFSVQSSHIAMAISCCDLSAPVSGGDQTECEASPIQTLTATAGNPGETITWFDAAVDGNEVANPTLNTVGSVIYYAELSTANCVSPERTAVTLTINATPNKPTATVTDPTCSTATGTVTVTEPVDGNTYILENDDNTYTAVDGVFSNVLPGTYSFNASNGTCNVDGDEVTVKNQPPTPFVTAYENSVCSGSSVQLTSNPSGGTWSGAHISASGLFDATGLAAGPYTVSYNYTNTDGCSNSDDATVTVNALPDVTADNKSVCTGSSVTLTGSPDGGTWSGGHVTVSTFNAAGLVATTYLATYTFQNGEGCSNSANATITVNALPVVSAGSDVSICNGGSTTLTASGATTYAWTPTGSLSAATGTSVTANPSSTTMYTVTGTDANNCSNTASVKVTVNPVPSCTISNTTKADSHAAGAGQAVNFGGPAAPVGSTYKYEWSFTSNTSGATFAGGATTATTQNVTVTTLTLGSYTLSLKVTDKTYSTYCNATCSYTITVSPTGPLYTYTQGYYNSTGSSCTPKGGLKGALALIQYALDNTDGIMGSPVPHTEKIVLGKPGASFTLNYADASKLVSIMPGGGTAGKLTGDLTVNNVPLKSGKINNVLLSQTLTLALNTYIQGDGLKDFILRPGYLTTQKGDLSKCPTVALVLCSKDKNAISSLKITTNTTLMSLLNGKPVSYLLATASAALGGTLPAGVTYADINNAVDVINKSFDGGRFLLGYYATAQSCSTIPAAGAVIASSIRVSNPDVIATKLTVAAYPNPFRNNVRFSIESPVSGHASLDVYNSVGQKMQTVYSGYLVAGKTQVIDYSLPATHQGNLIYTLRVGDKQVNGKLMQLK
jgi:hypothetical protein